MVVSVRERQETESRETSPEAFHSSGQKIVESGETFQGRNIFADMAFGAVSADSAENRDGFQHQTVPKPFYYHTQYIH